MDWLDPVSRSFAEREGMLSAYAILAACVVAAFFHDNHFVLLLFVTVLLYAVATLGLNIEFGYAGVLNFAGASFFGIGAYTSAVLNTYTAVPHVLVLLIGGTLAALIGSLLLLPVLRTRGHYAALVTIAFALLLKTFLEVNDVLGGPQGMSISTFSMTSTLSFLRSKYPAPTYRLTSCRTRCIGSAAPILRAGPQREMGSTAPARWNGWR